MKPGRPPKGQETSTAVLSVRLDREALEAVTELSEAVERGVAGKRSAAVRRALLEARDRLRAKRR